MRYWVIFAAFGLSFAALLYVSQMNLVVGRDDLALDMVEACIEASNGDGACTMNYALEEGRVTIEIGGVQVFCRSGRNGLSC
jgi:hypothetical protein